MSTCARIRTQMRMQRGCCTDTVALVFGRIGGFHAGDRGSDGRKHIHIGLAEATVGARPAD